MPPCAARGLGRRLLLRACLAAALLAGAAACEDSTRYPQEDVTLPRLAGPFVADPLRAAILQTTAVFASGPSQLAGRPAELAEAIMLYEFMTAQLFGPHFRREYQPHYPMLLMEGRVELRGLLGVAADAPTQPLIDRLWQAVEALRGNDAAAARAALAGGPFQRPAEETLARLQAPPRLNHAGRAAAAVAARMREVDQASR